MKNLITIALSLTMVMSGAYASDGKKYAYTVDLTNVVDDRVKVELITPRIKGAEVKFYMPKIIPGTYSVADYGRLIHDVQAFDKKGRPLDVVQADVNSWVIKKANKLARLTYWIEDSYDTDTEGPDIFEPAGTNIEAGKNFVLNSSGVFGYFEDMKQMEFEFNVIRDKEFYGSTGLIPVNFDQEVTHNLNLEGEENVVNNALMDTYSTGNYDAMVDSPLMYSKPDTAIIKVADTEVLIATYSPNKTITSNEIGESIREILMAQKEYLGGKLPVDKYAFVFYFTDGEVNSTGALEHSYSSMYFLQEQPLENIKQQLRGIAAHEFFHIVTPLNIHSKEIHEFDFNNPKMSKHLWLYEGVTEYFAGNVQVQHNIITPDSYLNMLRSKIVSSKTSFNDTLSFTNMSAGVLDKYDSQFLNVYRKGALIGMSLDIKLRHLSGSAYGLQSLMADLSKKFGKDKAFDDDELFGVITKMTYPEIGEFFNKHVSGTEPLPLDELFELVGVDHKASETYLALSLGLGDATVGFNEEHNKLMVINEERLDAFGKAFGFKNGDLILEIEGGEPPIASMGPFIGRIRGALKVGNMMTYKVSRKNSEGKYEEHELSAKIFQVERERLHILSWDENPSQEQLKMRKAWLNQK